MRLHVLAVGVFGLTIAGCGGHASDEDPASPAPSAVTNAESAPTAAPTTREAPAMVAPAPAIPRTTVVCAAGVPPPDGGCVPARALTDDSNATWQLAPGAALGPETRRFTALVTERECSSGASLDGRLLPTEIRYRPAAVTVTFRIQPLPRYEEDGSAISQTCEAVVTPVPVVLTQPLGARALADGYFEPPQPVRPPPG